MADGMSAEDRLIASVFAPVATHAGALGLTDDAAFVTPPTGCDLVLKTDAIIGGVHFFPEDDPGAIAQKAMRVNLSDLAAKGATPLGFLVALAIPRETDTVWLTAFAQGFARDAAAFSCPLFGGDTDRTPGPVTVAVSMFGSVPQGTMVRRAGARPGDLVFVSGTIGDAALGLLLRKDAAWPLAESERDHLLARYLLPQPRNALAEAVRTHASASMDVSDGLAGDLDKLCRVAGVAAAVDAAAVPFSSGVRSALAHDPALLARALSGGDDYEILCTVPPSRAASFRAAAAAAGVPVTAIGTVSAGAGARFLRDGQPIAFERMAFSHF